MTAAPLDRTVYWAPWNGPGLEHLRLRAADGGYVGTGVVLGVRQGTPFCLHYKIKCDAGWRTRKVVLEAHTPSGEAVRTLRADGRGRWHDDDGADMPPLEGSIDIDIAVTPFTNTIAIQRLGLKPGQAADIEVVYVSAPTFALRPVKQRYSCLERNAKGGIVTYEGLFRGFKGDLPIDADGLVFDYPETFRRVYPL